MSQKTCSACGAVCREQANFCYRCGSTDFAVAEPAAPAVAPAPPVAEPAAPAVAPAPPVAEPAVPAVAPAPPVAEPAAPAVAPAPAPQPPFASPQQPPQQPLYGQLPYGQPPYAPMQPAPKKKGWKWWHFVLMGVGALIALIVLICVIVGIGGAVLYTSEYSGEQPNEYGEYVVGDALSESVEAAQNSKTVMIYLVGSNLESVNGAASEDIQEMVQSGVDTEKNNVLIYTGGAKEWAIDGIPADKNCIFRVVDGDIELLKEYPSVSMGEASTLEEFLSYGVEQYAADDYALILWNHGAGPMIGYGSDEVHGGDLLEMTELKTALADAGFGSGRKLEFLGFDACLMGSAETAWCVKDYADYLIASQETEPGFGWDYRFLKQLSDYDSGEDLGKVIIDCYFTGYEEIVAQYPQAAADMTLSCMDLSKIHLLEDSLNALFSKVDEGILGNYFPEASRHRNSVKSFGKFATSFEYDLIDVAHMVSLLSADYQSETAQVNSALSEFICYSRSNISNASGVSIYHPYENRVYMEDWIDQFGRLGFATEYARYISDFKTMLLKPSSISWKSFQSTRGVAEKTKKENELSVKLTDEQMQNYASSSYYILKKMENDEYLFIYAGFDTELDKKGNLTASYDGKSLFSVNDKTGEASDGPVMMIQLRDGGIEEKYSVGAMFMKFGDDITDWEAVPVDWLVKMEDGQPQFLGAYESQSKNEEYIPQKYMLDYTEFDLVQFASFTYKLTKDDDGNVLPYFQWDTTGNFYYYEYEVEDGFHLEARDIANTDDYMVMFVVEDIYGNSYACEMFELPAN